MLHNLLIEKKIYFMLFSIFKVIAQIVKMALNKLLCMLTYENGKECH